MIERARALRPVVEAIFRANREIVDAGIAVVHDALGIEFPIFVAVRAIPLPGIVAPFVGEADRDPVVVEGPEILDEAVLEFAIPFAGEELDDLFPTVDEFGAIAPSAVDGIGQRDVLRVT